MKNAMSYPKGDLRRMLAVIAAVEAIPQATLVKIAALTGLDKKSVTHQIAEAGKQAEVTIIKEGPVYTLKDWGPYINPVGARDTLTGGINAPTISIQIDREGA
jgi:hypothetical protein